MGGGQSAPQLANYCSFKKTEFKETIEIIKDSHAVMQYYASILLLSRMPNQLPMYKNYTPLSEAVFNYRRLESISGINTVDDKLNSYYDVYNMLKTLKPEFEKTLEESGRREQITKIFNVTYAVMKSLTEELASSCEYQNIPEKK